MVNFFRIIRHAVRMCLFVWENSLRNWLAQQWKQSLNHIEKMSKWNGTESLSNEPFFPFLSLKIAFIPFFCVSSLQKLVRNALWTIFFIISCCIFPDLRKNDSNDFIAGIVFHFQIESNASELKNSIWWTFSDQHNNNKY